MMSDNVIVRKNRRINIGLFVILALYANMLMAQAESDARLEEIVVTARKIDESLQDVSLAVTALSGARLERSIINDITDLNSIVPTLNISEIVGGQTVVSMRGLGNTSNNAGQDPDVIVHVDGAVVDRTEILDMAFFDLERIEVVRGPTALYGRNTTVGTVNLITAKPTMEPEGYINLSGGNYNYAEAGAAVSGPLVSDKILGRVAYNFIQRAGFGENPVTGNDVGDDKRQQARGHLQFNINEDVQLLLTGEYGKRDDSSNSVPNLRELFPDSDDPRLVAPGRGGFAPNKSFDVAGDIDPQLEKETWAVTGTLDWRLNERFFTKTILNYREFDVRRIEDLDVSSIVNTPERTGELPTISNISPSGEQFSAEFQLHHQGEVLGRNMQAIVGLYYLDESLASLLQIGTAQQLTSDPRTSDDPAWFFVPGSGKIEAFSTFWNIQYDITDQVSLRVGGRFTDEDRSIDNDMFIVPGAVGGREAQFANTDLPIDGSRGFNDYTNQLGIDYRLSDEVLFYYTFSEGFKSGAGLLAQFNSPITGPTKIDNHEFGMKSQWLDRRLTVNLTGFFSDVNGVQRATRVTEEEVGVVVRFTNGVQMDVSGIELESNWAMTDELRFNTSVAYLDAEITDFLTVDNLDPASILEPMGGFVNVAGNPPRRSPDWKMNLQGEYDLHLPGNKGFLTFSVSGTWTDEHVLIEDSRPLRDAGVQDSYGIIDASIRYTPPGNQKWHFTFWGKNLTDKKVTLARQPGAFTGAIRATLNDPLTAGATFNYDFF